MNKNLNIKSRYNSSNKYQKQSGFSLIEIMVAALVLSIGILGVASLQILGLKGTHQSSMKQHAVSVLQNLTERMHANKQGVIAGNYNNIDSSTFDCSVLPSCSSSSSNCSIADIAVVDLNNVICGYKKGSAPSTGGVEVNATGDISPFVDGELDINCVAGDCSVGDVQINIQWSERAFGKEEVVRDSLFVTTRITP